MTAYIVAIISVHDRDRYERYTSGFMSVLRAHGGQLLAADEEAVALSGEPAGHKVVLAEFPDLDRARAWWESPEYQAIAMDRAAAASGPIALVRGLAAPTPLIVRDG